MIFLDPPKNGDDFDLSGINSSNGGLDRTDQIGLSSKMAERILRADLSGDPLLLRFERMFKDAARSKYEKSALIMIHGREGTGVYIPDLTISLAKKVPCNVDLSRVEFNFSNRLPRSFEGPNKDGEFNGSSNYCLLRRKEAFQKIVGTAAELSLLSSESAHGKPQVPTMVQLSAAIFLKTAKKGAADIEFSDCIHYMTSAYANASVSERSNLPWRGPPVGLFKSLATGEETENLFDSTAQLFLDLPGRMFTSTEILKKAGNISKPKSQDRIMLGVVLETLETLGLCKPQPWHLGHHDDDKIQTSQSSRSRPIDVYASSLATPIKPDWLRNHHLEILGILHRREEALTSFEILAKSKETSRFRVPVLNREGSAYSALSDLCELQLVSFNGSGKIGSRSRVYFLTETGKELAAAWSNTRFGRRLPNEPYEQVRTKLVGLWKKNEPRS